VKYRLTEETAIDQVGYDTGLVRAIKDAGYDVVKTPADGKYIEQVIVLDSAAIKTVRDGDRYVFKGESVSPPPVKAADLASMSDEDFDKMLDEAEGEVKAKNEPPPAPKRSESGGMLMGEGEVATTVSGRKTSPFPKVDMGSDRKVGNSLKRSDKWLHSEALVEASARADNFNYQNFEGMNPDRLSPADRDGLNEYLFNQDGWMPPVQAPVTRALTPKIGQKGVTKAPALDLSVGGQMRELPGHPRAGYVVHNRTGGRSGFQVIISGRGDTPGAIETSAIGETAQEAYDNALAKWSQVHAPAPKIGQKGVTKAPKAMPSAIIESAAKHGVKGIDEAAKGLYELFGAGKRLGMGVPLDFDKDTYAKAKPHFQKAHAEFSAAGRDLKDFAKWALTTFGSGIRPYLHAFKNDLAGESGKADNTDEGGGDEHASDSGSDQSRSPEGAQVGVRGRRPGPGKDAGSMEDSSPSDAGGTPKGGSGEVAGPIVGGKGDGADGGATGEATVTDGRPGAVGTGLVPDRAGGRGESGVRPGRRPDADRDGRTPASVKDVQPNFRITDPEALVGGGPKTKFAKNKKAIETYLRVVSEGRPATEEERLAIASYIGWGSFGQDLFNGSWDHPRPKEGWEDESSWLRDHLGEERWKSAQRSITNAHYTDPPTVAAMWDMARRMGFEGGRVLEPSMGIGNFFGLMPSDIAERSSLTGIELDEITGGMAKLLYPQANISIKGYQDSRTPDGFYDLVIGNWPFAADGPADRRYNKLAPSLHDYFFLKALDQVRVGGLVVGITSAGTMDKVGQQVRLEMSKKADLVASFRLPTGAFGKYAGTAVVTDIIILRKREQEKGIQAVPAWVGTTDMETPAGVDVRINNYYHENKRNVLGTINYGSGTTQGRAGMIVDRPKNFADRLAAAIEGVPVGIYQADTTAKKESYVTNNAKDRVNSVMVDESGELWVSQGEQKVKLEDRLKIALKSAAETEKRREQIRALVGIRQSLGVLVDQQRDNHDSTEDTRKQVRADYLAFVKQYGRINDSYALSQLKKVNDPHFAQLAALERNTARHDETPKYVEATILTRSTVRPRPRPENLSIQDAYVFQRNENLMLDVDRIAELANVGKDEAIAELEKANAIFRTPAGGIAHADEYLSGNVRLKLNEARNAKADGIAGMDRNIEALEKVVPEDVPYYNIEAKLGNNWTPPNVYRTFVGEMLGVDLPTALTGVDVNFSPRGWKVRISKQLEGRAEANSNYGMVGVPFSKLIEHGMRSTPVVVKYYDSEVGHMVVDEKASAAANEKVTAIQEHFSEWLWKDPTRRVDLEKAYNESYNNAALPSFSGDFLAFEGMMLERGDKAFNLRRHQESAIARGLITGRGLYAHEVGTGKTYTMGGIAVESRRYGKARKPIIFAHNANSATVAAEINEMYPGAKVLYVDNLSKENKAVTLAQIANDEWDAIVVPHSMIDKFALKADTYAALAAGEIAELEAAAIEAAQEDGADLDVSDMDDEEAMKKIRSPTAKDLVRARNRIITRIEKMSQKAAEDAIILEDAGIDMIIVDEAHEFKKPPIATSMRMKGLNTSPSDRSINMMFLLQYINGINNGRGVHLFTGTPITNTLNELYNMMRFVMPAEMKAEGVEHWDAWFNTFAAESTDVEVTAAGDYEPISRLASFVNVPELRLMAGQYMDTVFAEQMPEFKDRETVDGKTMSSKDLPEADRGFLTNGRTEDAIGRPYKIVKTVVSPMTPAQLNIRNSLLARAQSFRNMSKKQRRDVMLSGSNLSPIIVETDAAKAGLDARLFSMEAPDDPRSKVNTAINNVMHHYEENPLSCQVLFMEKGFSDHVDRTKTVGEGANRRKETTRYPSLNLAKDIVNKLVDRGIPREQIAIVDGSVSKLRRKAISDMMNTGEIRVVIGSTQTLGTGVNMQANLRAMHHLDAPWKPGDLEQRNGRGHRQGNKWNSVIEYRYVTEGIDGRRWQVLVIKDRFIREFLRNKGKQRIIEGDAASMDDDEGTNDMASTLSDATGDPRILLIEKAKKDIEKYQRRERLYTEGLYETQATIKGTERKIEDAQAEEKRRSDIETLLSATADAPFSVTLDGATFTDRKSAEAKLEKMTAKFQIDKSVVIGEFRGFELRGLTVKKSWFTSELEEVVQVVHPKYTEGTDKLIATASIAGVEAVLRSNHRQLVKVTETIADYKRTVLRLTKSLDEPFPQQAQLDKAAARQTMLEGDLRTNPIPPPAWLRQPTPIGTSVTFKAEPRIVSGHKWSDAGWFVQLEPKTDGGAIEDAPYQDIYDEQGVRVYEDRQFDKPATPKKTGAQADPHKPATPKKSDSDQDDLDMARGSGGIPAMRGASAKNKGVKQTQAADIMSAMKRLWPKLSIRGAGTFRKKAGGWYSRVLGEMRLRDARDADTALHELGHHFDRELGMYSKKTGIPPGVAAELIRLGRDLYGNTRPAAGYRPEGFAEFVRGFLTGQDMAAHSPRLHQWFTTDYLTAHPDEAKKLREIEDIITNYRTQSPEQFVRAFRQPLREDWSAARLASIVAGLEVAHRDANLPILRAMQESGADLSAINPSNDPYMLATLYSRSAGGRALHAALNNTTDLYGRTTGEGLREVLSPVSSQGSEALENWKDYAIARRAMDLHGRQINPGISREDAQAVVDKYESPEFRAVTDAVTEWSRRQLRLLVDSGAMTEDEFGKIERDNPVYVPFARQFFKDEIRDGRKRSGRGVYRLTKKGSGREIHDPLDALIMQSEQIVATAMKADIVRALVQFYDANKGKAKALGLMMSEVPAPMEATTFTAEKIKDAMADIAVNRMGADPAMVAAAMLDTWTERMTVFTDAKEYRGKAHVVSVVVDGTRRFFEVKPDLAQIIEDVGKERFLPHALGFGELSRQLVGLQRLGATGLNPAFGLVRNMLRDTLTASITADYHFHVPIWSTIQGSVMDILNTDLAATYHSMGLDMSGRMGQDIRLARKVGDRVAASTPAQRAAEFAITPQRWINGLREVMAHTEVGPRLMEFRGAYKYAMDKWGDARDAAVLGGCASKDSTVNFSRAGTAGRQINEIILFWNAAVQSVDKALRAMGVFEAAPWAKSDSKSKTALRTVTRAAMFITAAAIANYIRNRDDDWWKDLPPYEKWGYLHTKLAPGLIMRIPLPFEFGALFGALTVALIEESRNPGAFKEALWIAGATLSPVELETFHKLLRNVSGLAPIADVVANKDWKGDTIVPKYIEDNRVDGDHYTYGTSEFAKMVGKHIDYSPAKIDHLLNGFTAGLYKRLAIGIEQAADPSAIGAGGDLSNFPVAGTLFLRPGTSRVTNEFYDRIVELKKKKGSRVASLAEIGELAAAEKLSKDLQEKFSARREIIQSKRTAEEIKIETDALMMEIQGDIKAHQKKSEEDQIMAGVQSVVYAATDPKAADADRAQAEKLLADVDDETLRKALRAEHVRRGGKLPLRTNSGRPTALGKRLARLNSLTAD
jgi:N12 class adenine-specific DNA methylase